MENKVLLTKVTKLKTKLNKWELFKKLAKAKFGINIKITSVISLRFKDLWKESYNKKRNCKLSQYKY